MIVVLLLDRVPAGLRGDISRWMVEPRSGVFVGRVSPQVRDRLWDRASQRLGDGAALMIYENARAEQGVSFRQLGDRTRDLVDFDGVTLIGHQADAGGADASSESAT